MKSFTPQRVLTDSFITREHNHEEKWSLNNEGSINLQRSATPYNSGHKIHFTQQSDLQIFMYPVILEFLINLLEKNLQLVLYQDEG